MADHNYTCNTKFVHNKKDYKIDLLVQECVDFNTRTILGRLVLI